MTTPDKAVFVQVWPKCFVIFLGIILLLAGLILCATELGNVATNFWTTNVFAGGWCGIIVLIHAIALFVASCGGRGPAAAFRAVVITVIALVASATLISFDAYFIAQPSTCILTSSCAANAVSTTIFSYNFQSSFFTMFNNLGPFKNYTSSQAKFLFQTIQLGVGCLCFILCIIYLIIYYVTKSKASKVSPANRRQQQQQPGHYAPQSAQQYPPQQQQYPPQQQQYPPQQQQYPPQQQQYPPQQQQYPPQQQYQQSGPSYRQPPPRVPQATPGEVPWAANNRRY